MLPENELAAVADAVAVAVKSAAGRVVGDGHAVLALVEDPEGDPLVQLKPEAPGAAPLQVRVDTEQQISCFPGRSGMIVELFSGDPEELARGAGDLAAAVVAGTYCEWVSDAGAKTRIAAQWVEGGRTVKARLNVLLAPRRSARSGGSWRFVRYEAY